MSFSIDLNLLLYSVDEQSPFHKEAKHFLRSCLKSEGLCILTWETIYGFLRVATHPGIFKNPLPMKSAIQNIHLLISQPNVQLLSATKSSWDIFVRLTDELSIKGNIVPDAVLASILEANGVKKLFSKDRDFRRFTFLKTVDPF